MKDIDQDLINMAKSGNLEIVKLLLENGADVGARGNHALEWASYNGHYKVVKLLLENGADVGAEDNYALRWASEYNHHETIKILKSYME